MKITKSNALQFASNCINRAKSISDIIRTEIALMKKTAYKRDLSKDFAEIDKLNTLANKALKLLDNIPPGYSFAEQTESTITKYQIRDSVLTIAKQIKNITAFLLKQIEKETNQLIDKDYSALLKKLESTMKVINGEVNIYKDESTWLFAESKTDYRKNENVRYQIGWKVPLLGRLVDALELKIKKENEENSSIDHTKFLTILFGSLKSFDEDLKQYRSNPNAPFIQTNKLLNKLTGSSFTAFDSGYEIETISSNEFAELSDLESDPNIKVDLNNREQLHKAILKIQTTEKINYLEAFNKVIKKNE